MLLFLVYIYVQFLVQYLAFLSFISLGISTTPDVIGMSSLYHGILCHIDFTAIHIVNIVDAGCLQFFVCLVQSLICLFSCFAKVKLYHNISNDNLLILNKIRFLG